MKFPPVSSFWLTKDQGDPKSGKNKFKNMEDEFSFLLFANLRASFRSNASAASALRFEKRQRRIKQLVSHLRGLGKAPSFDAVERTSRFDRDKIRSPFLTGPCIPKHPYSNVARAPVAGSCQMTGRSFSNSVAA
jgi:hypothetical protein